MACDSNHIERSSAAVPQPLCRWCGDGGGSLESRPWGRRVSGSYINPATTQRGWQGLLHAQIFLLSSRVPPGPSTTRPAYHPARVPAAPCTPNTRTARRAMPNAQTTTTGLTRAGHPPHLAPTDNIGRGAATSSPHTPIYAMTVRWAVYK